MMKLFCMLMLVGLTNPDSYLSVLKVSFFVIPSPAFLALAVLDGLFDGDAKLFFLPALVGEP
jgi:hypothetical protein